MQSSQLSVAAFSLRKMGQMPDFLLIVAFALMRMAIRSSHILRYLPATIRLRDGMGTSISKIISFFVNRWNVATFEELQSDKAIVTHREINCDQGCATVYSVLLADGFLIETGSSGYAHIRACILAEIINSSGPERLSRDAMEKYRMSDEYLKQIAR